MNNQGTMASRMLKLYTRLVIFSGVLLLVLQLTLIPAQAALNTLDQVVDQLNSVGIDELPDDFKAMEEWLKSDEAKDPSALGSEDEIQRATVQKAVYSKLVTVYKTQSKYNAFLKEFTECCLIEDGAIVKNPDMKGDSGEKRYNKVITSFSTTAGTTAVEDTADKLFGTDNFDPNNNFMSPVMQWVYYLVNTFFSVTAQLVIWLTLAQAGADVLYISVDFTRAFLVPFSKELRGGGGGMMGGQENIRKWALPVISEEAYRAIHGAGATGMSASMSGSDSAVGRNKVWSYVAGKTPVIIMGATYLIMVYAGWWPRLISIISGVVISGFTYVLNFLGVG